MTLGEAHVIQGNALDLPLPNNSVDLVCTSPPYFGLRSYQDGGKHYEGQIGSEATPQEFLDALLAATREMVRVLKPSGSIFVNLGDKYAGSSIDNRERPPGAGLNNPRNSSMRSGGVIRAPKTDVRAKSLMGIPWRYALRCIDDLGLILRAEIIWQKPNALPESVTDRVRRSHEQWFHMTVQPKYFAAVDEIREPHTGPDVRHFGTITPEAAELAASRRRDSGTGSRGSITQAKPREYNPLGKLPGSVWSIPTQPLTVPPELGVDHFAAYPMEWPRRIIQGWTPNGICVECGEGRRPVTTVERDHGWVRQTIGSGGQRHPGESIGQNVTNRATHTIVGFTCKCIERQATHDETRRVPPETGSHTQPAALQRMAGMGAPDAGPGLHAEKMPQLSEVPHLEPRTRPAVVLDPFGGTGTTALVAKALGRTGISVDLSHDYCRMAVWRTNDPGELAAALQVEKPEPVPDGQVTLF